MDISNIKVDSLDDMIGAFNARIKKLKKSADGFDIKESSNNFMENKAKLYKITYTDNESKDGYVDDISIYAENENDARNKFKTYINKKDRFDIDSIEVDLVLTEDCKEETITEDIVDKLRDFTPADDASYGGIKNFPNGDKPQYGEVLSGNFDASFTVGCNLEDDLVIDIILGTPEDDGFEPYNEYQYAIEVDSDNPQDIEDYVSFAKNFTKVTMSKIDKLFDAEDVDKYLMKNRFTRINSEWYESLSIKESINWQNADFDSKEFHIDLPIRPLGGRIPLRVGVMPIDDSEDSDEYEFYFMLQDDKNRTDYELDDKLVAETLDWPLGYEAFRHVSEEDIDEIAEIIKEYFINIPEEDLVDVLSSLMFEGRDYEAFIKQTSVNSSTNIKESNSSKDAIDITELFNKALDTISEYIEVVFSEQLGIDITYHKVFKTVSAAEKYNYHSDYWNSAEVYQENTSELVKMFKPYFGKKIRLNNEDYAFEGKLIGVDIDTQYNGHLALRVDNPVEL